MIHCSVEPPKTDTLRDRLKYPSERGVRLVEVIENIDIQLKILYPQLILVGRVLLGIIVYWSK